MSIATAEFAEYINAQIEENTQFELSAPCQVTRYRERDKSYSSVPLIGGEIFHPKMAYVGKTKKLIFKFLVPELDDEFCHYEFTVAQAKSQLDGFKKFISKLEIKYEEEVIHSMREVGAAKEAAADETARRHSDPLFGSW